jgi:membrane protein
MLLSILVDLTLRVVETFFDRVYPISSAHAGQAVNYLASFAIVTVLFALIYKFVPNVPIDWRDVAIGSVVTAVLFSIGRALLALYLTKAAVGSAFGAAGSLVAFVVWIYYSAQIFLYGATLTRAYALMFGSRRHRRAVPGLSPSKV